MMEYDWQGFSAITARLMLFSTTTRNDNRRMNSSDEPGAGGTEVL